MSEPPPGYLKTANALLLAFGDCLALAKTLGGEVPRFRMLPKDLGLAASLHDIGMELAVNDTAKIIVGALIEAARGANADVTYMMFRAVLAAYDIEPEICGLSDLGLTPAGTKGSTPS